MQDFNRFEIPLALRGFLDTAENPQVAMSEDVQPVVSVGDVTDTPYLRYGIPCSGRTEGPGVAAKYAWTAVVPGAQVALQVCQMVFTNNTAGILAVDVRLVLSSGFLSPTASDYLCDLAPRTTTVNRSSRLWKGADALDQSPLGYLCQLQLPANGQVIFDVPRPGIILFGDAGTALLVQGLSLAASAGFFGVTAREWPLPGIKQ